VNAEVINKFLGATTTVLGEYFNIKIEPGGKAEAVAASSPMEPVSVLLEMTGDLAGQFVFGCKPVVALDIARAMMMNPDYPSFDDMCRSALAELGNMIAGMTSTGLSEMGIFVDLVPPLVVTGENVSIHFSVPVIIGVPLNTSAGEIRVCIALKSSAAA
jgi:chemotaxis protein CheX